MDPIRRRALTPRDEQRGSDLDHAPKGNRFVDAVGIAVMRLVAAHSSILREVLRHLVEEGYLPPDKAARIVSDAANEDLPPEESTCETYDIARDELLLIAQALGSWPGKPESESGRRGPQPDQP